MSKNNTKKYISSELKKSKKVKQDSLDPSPPVTQNLILPKTNLC